MQARDLLVQLPEPLPAPRPSPPARTAPAVPARAGGQPAPAAAVGEDTPPAGKRVFTSDDLPRGVRPAGERRPVPLPPSLQAAQVPVESVKASTQDDLRVVSAGQEQGQLVLQVEYTLLSQHSRPVFVGAWVQVGSVSRYFGYSPPVAPGRGTVRVVLVGAPADVSTLRIAFLESGGQRFLVKDVTLQR